MEADPDAAATSTTDRAEQADAKVVPRSLLPTMPERWLHVVVLSTDLQDMPDTFISLLDFSHAEEYKISHSKGTLD